MTDAPFFVIAAFLAALFPTSALGFQVLLPMVCSPTVELEKLLRQKYQEEIVGFGISAEPQIMIQRWESLEGTWSIVLKKSNGQSCLAAASGDEWQRIEPVYGDPS